MVRVNIRSTFLARRIAERASLTALVFLAVLSLATAVEHIRVASGPLPPASRPNQPQRLAMAARPTTAAHPTPPRPPAVATPSPDPSVQFAAPPHPVLTVPAASPAAPPALVSEEPHPVLGPETKTPELLQMARIVPRMRDTFSGEADRSVPASRVTTVGVRHKDVPMLRDDAALETWGGEFASGDSRLREMIQAGALTSVTKGTPVKVLEVRGPLTRVEIVGQNRAGWIRSTCIVR